MKALLRYSLIFLIFLPAQVYGNGAKNDYFQWLKVEEARLQVHLKDYRLITEIESFPERFNATIAVPIKTDPEGAIAGLHDPITGEPLEACLTPCKLHVDNVSDYALVIFKFGYRPQDFPLSHLEAQEPYNALWLGINYYEVILEHLTCLVELKSGAMADQDAKVCKRVPPIMPAMAERSGHCMLTFDLTPDGIPENIQANSCSESLFEEEAKNAVSWWRYYPKVERGQTVSRTGIETKINFRLTDRNGDIIAE